MCCTSMRGADPVNNELEVGFDERFETRWWRVETVGRAAMVLFIVAGLAGFLGRGPFSHRTVRSEDAGLSVDFEPLARSQTPTQVTLHIANPAGDTTLDVTVSGNIVEPFGLMRVEPQPIRQAGGDNSIVFTIAVPPGASDAMVRLALQPSGIGPVRLTAQVANRPAVAWTQWMLP